MASTPYKHFVPPVPINPDYDKNLTYVLIESLDQLKESFKKGYVIAWDTETTGLNPVESDIVGFSYTYDGITGYYCPVKHFDLALGKPALDLFYQALRDSKLQLLYNARFDIRMMEYSGYDMSFLYPKDPKTNSSNSLFIDVMNQVWLADTNIPLPSLKSSTLHFLGYQPPKFLETLGDEQNFQYVPAKEAYRYACFTQDTLIQTKDGLKQISELRPHKDLIKTSTGYKRLLNILPQGLHNVIRVTPPIGLPFTCTPDHKFAIQSSNSIYWIQAKDLDKIPFFIFYHGGESLNDKPDYDFSTLYNTGDTCTIEYLDEQQPVYDLTVEEEHNFFLQCGIIAHNCLDAINTYNLFKVTYKYYKESGLASRMDNSCVYIIGELEKTPLNIDTEYLISLRDKVYNRVLELEQEIYSIAGHQFKIGSNRELTQVFLEQGIDTGERTKSGDMKTGIELLNLYLRNHPECTLLNLLIEYKEQFKFYNSYLKTLVDIAKQQSTVPPRFSYKLQSVPCLTENNFVLIKDKGIIPISQVQEQDLIWTQYGYKRVLWCNSHKSNNIYRVVFNNSLYIEGTAHHPVLVNNGDEFNIKLEWSTLESLNIGENVVFNHHTPLMDYTQDEEEYTSYLEYLGFLSSYHIEPSVELLEDYINSKIEMKEKSSVDFQNLTKSINDSIYSLMELVLHSNPYQWVSFLQGLLYGVFETDVAKQWNKQPIDRFIIRSKQPVFLTFIMSILYYLGIPNTLCYDDQSYFIELSSVQSLTLFNTIIVSESDSLYLKSFFSSYNTSGYYTEYADSKVKYVERLTGEHTVYDIEVENVHEYVANGVITHNTGRLSCVTGDTLIPTIIGNIPIGELSLYEEGNEVFIDANSTARFHTLYMGEKPVVEIHLNNGRQITATLDHRFMNPKTDWVYVNDLKVGDLLLCVIDNKLTYTSITNIIPKKELEPVWTLTVDHINHQYLSNSLISHNCGKDGKNTYFAPINLQCLEENTIIKTDRGNIPIKQVTDNDLVWTGTRFVPCKPLGSKQKECFKIKTLWGEIEASLEHRFLTLNIFNNYTLEWHTLAECISRGLPLVRDPQSTGTQFDELYHHPIYSDHSNKEYEYHNMYSKIWTERKELSLDEYKYYLKYYRDYKFDIIIDCSFQFWRKSPSPELIKTVYDLYVPEYNQFTANGFIVHNSLPKPKSIKCYGRKATQEEIDNKKDTLGWVFSPDYPEWSPGLVVEGMNQYLNVRAAFQPEHPENGDYVVSIDMCLEAGSPVQTKRGYIGVSELKIGDFVLSPDGWIKVIRVAQTGIKKLIKVTPKGGGQAVYCSEEHPFIINGEKIEAKYITEPVPSSPFYSYNRNIDNRNDIIKSLSPLLAIDTPRNKANYIIENNLKDVIVEGLNKYTRANVSRWCGVKLSSFGHVLEYLNLPNTGKSYRCKFDSYVNNPFIECTPTSSYLLGFIYGDGNISERRSGYLTLNISSKDFYHLKRIGEIFGQDVNIRYNTKGGKEWFTLDIHNTELCRTLMFLGVKKRKSYLECDLPISWLGDNLRHFIRGLLDSDGSVRHSTHSYLEFSLVGHDSYIRKLYEISPNIWRYKSEKTFSILYLNGTKDDKRFIYNYLYEGATIWLQRKRDIIDKWYQDNFGDIVMPVWDITVDSEDHLYYVNGILTHNCGEELRVVTNLFKEHNWAKVINAGGDLHHANSDAIFGPENYTKETRKRSKGAAFGMLYGQEYKGFQRKFPDMSLDEAKEFMIKFKRTIPSIVRGQERMIKEAQRTGTFYTGFGRPRRVKHYLTSSDYKDVAFGKRTCMNGPIQGTAADVLKLEFIRLWDNIFTVFPEIKFICTIHDEINFSVPRHLADKVIPMMVRCMTVKMPDWLVTLDCSLSCGPTLGEQYPFKYNFDTKEFIPDWEEDKRKDSNKEVKQEIEQEYENLDQESEEEEIREGDGDNSIEEIDSKMFDF